MELAGDSDILVTRAMNRNYCLADGFEDQVRKSMRRSQTNPSPTSNLYRKQILTSILKSTVVAESGVAFPQSLTTDKIGLPSPKSCAR
jgi:hypothetical protein